MNNISPTSGNTESCRASRFGGARGVVILVVALIAGVAVWKILLHTI